MTTPPTQPPAIHGIAGRDTIDSQRVQGFLYGMEAVERAGLPRTKNGANTLYNLRNTHAIPATKIGENWFFSVNDLDAYREKRAANNRVLEHPNAPPHWASVRTITTPRRIEPDVELSPDTPETDDDDEDYGEMEAAAQTAARRALKRMNITRWRHMDTREVEQHAVRAWHIAVTLPNGITRKEVRVVLEHDRYIAQSEDVLAFLESENTRLTQELAVAQRMAKANKGNKKRAELRDWHDRELFLPIWIEELGGNNGEERRISSDDFPTVTASGLDLERATANYRLLLRGLLCAYSRHRDAGHELKFAQEAQLEKLQLLFDEL